MRELNAFLATRPAFAAVIGILIAVIVAGCQPGGGSGGSGY